MFNFINNLFKPVDEDKKKNLETLKLVNKEMRATVKEYMCSKDVDEILVLLKKYQSLSRAKLILEETLY